MKKRNCDLRAEIVELKSRLERLNKNLFISRMRDKEMTDLLTSASLNECECYICEEAPKVMRLLIEQEIKMKRGKNNGNPNNAT